MGRTLLLATLAAVVALAWNGTPAPAEGARLDPTFGSAGRMLLPGGFKLEERSFRGPGEARPLADGRVLVALGQEVVALLPSGEVDTGFGEAGRIRAWAPAGYTASFSSFTVDQAGRPILVGSSSPIGAEPGPHGDLPTQAFFQRFTSDGRIDLSFGSGDGTLVTDFGLPPALQATTPQVSANSVMPDGSGRLVVTGQRAEGIEFAGKAVVTYRGREGFVARLTPAGEVDRSFATAGSLPVPGSELIRSPIVEPEDGLYAVASGDNDRVIRLDPHGGFDSTFGEAGGRPLPWVSHWSHPMQPIGLNPPGHLLLAAGLPGWGDRFRPRRLVFRRILPDGSRDRGYGRNGLQVFHFPRLKMADVAMDQAGRLLIAMSLGDRNSRKKKAPPTEMALVRLRSDGSLEPSFGRRGVLPIPFPGKRELYLGELILQGDERAVVRVDTCKKRCRTMLLRVDFGLSGRSPTG